MSGAWSGLDAEDLHAEDWPAEDPDAEFISFLPPPWHVGLSMIRKSGSRFSEKIMLH
jgi:hypothetical protein